VLETLGRAPTAFMMRAKDAETDPFTQIKTAIGSGPFIFLPGRSGSPARVSLTAATRIIGHAPNRPAAMPAARSPKLNGSNGRSSRTRQPRLPC